MPVKPANVTSSSNKRRVTLKDIAKALDIAPSTVSNAYNRPDQLSESLREKILATADALGYVGPNPMARSLRKGVTNTIGVVYPSSLSYAFTNPVAGLFVQGIALEVERQGYTLLLMGGEKGHKTSADPLAPTTANVDGFIVHCFAEGDALLQAALARTLPTVLVDQPQAGDLQAGDLQAGNLGEHVNQVASVGVDDEAGAYAAAKHVLELGHRRLGIVSLELDLHPQQAIIDSKRQSQARYGPTRARLQGYRRAVQDARLVWEDTVRVFECCDNRPADGRHAAEVLLDSDLPPTAILTMSDQMALGVLETARARDLPIPADVSVVGFDDMPSAAQARPALTTVHQPHIDKGKHAGRLLLAQLQTGQGLEAVRLPTRLVVRQSTAAPPRADSPKAR
jgi:DNA-binding LacI/PurR family transcriptional regulator